MVDLCIPNKISGVEAILFDLDGTLIDSLDLHIEAFQWILDKLGRSIGRQQLEPLMGKTPQDIIREFFSDLDKDQLLEAARQKEDHLNNLITNVYVYPGISSFLNQLHQKGVRRIVISSTHRKLVKVLLGKAGLLPLIDDIVSGDEVSHGKPDPEPFRLGYQKSKVGKSKCLAIGDSVHDYQSANAAGIRFIGLLTGKTLPENFRDAGCSNVVNKMTEIQICP